MELTVQNVYGLLLRSKLLSIDQAKAAFARWNDEAKDNAGNLVKFMSWMVAHKHLTEYQAQMLARGHADGFFLNDYKILDRLGKGRMAGVYKAQYKLGQTVAIKVLPPSKAKDAQMLGRFRREAKLATRLRHPNVVRTFQVGQSGTLHYLVMEYLVGETLEDVLARRKQLPPAEAASLVYQALLGLQHIHEQGLVHRDLKPSNLMLTPAGGATTAGCAVKILDIGLGRMMEDGGGGDDDGGLTGEGVLLGTPDYMAPEQARDARATDVRADIYSLGCVLYHLIAGQPPFPDTNIISQMIRHASEPARPLVEFNKAVPDGLQQIVNWMIAKKPEERYPTPSRAASALEMFLAAGELTASSPDLDPNMATYLKELEQQEASAPPSGAAIPTAQIPTVPHVTLPDPPKPERRPKGDKRDRVERRSKQPPPPPPSGEPAAALPRIDVELVATPLAPDKPPPRDEEFFGPFSRRDFIMFFAGVGMVILAILLGQGLAWLLFGRRRKPDAEPEPDPPSD